MKTRTLVALCLSASAAVALAADALAFKKVQDVPLPGGAGFDYVRAEAGLRRLLVAHGTKIDVLDLDTAKKLGEVDGVEGAHGALIVADAKKGFATAGRKKKLIVFDPETFKVTKEVETGEGPDAILYCATTKEVWTMNHRAGTITCVDVASLEVKATIEVGGALESAAEWTAKGMVFVNVENKDQIAAIDAKKHAVTARYALDPAKEPTGLAIDEKNGLLFAGCGSGHLAVVDAASGKVIATPAIGDHCDAAAFDAERNLAFASCGDGTTTVVRDDAAGEKKFPVAAKIETAKGGKTCTLDAKTHRLWIAAGTRGKDDVHLLVFASDEAAPAAGEVH